jgi:hypothetical protein
MRVDPVDKGRKDNTVGASTPDSIPWMAPMAAARLVAERGATPRF